MHDAVFSAISFGRAISKRELPGKAENWNTEPTVMDQEWNKIYLTKRASPSLDGAKSFVFHTIETFPIKLILPQIFANSVISKSVPV